MTPIVFLWVYAAIQLLGLFITAFKMGRDDAEGSGWLALVVGSVLFGGLLWTILNVVPKTTT